MHDDDAPHDEGEDGGEERQVGDERAVDEHGDPRLQVAVEDHDPRDPVERAGEVHDPRNETEREGSSQRSAGKRDEQWRERDPAEGRVTVLRKTQGEKDARRCG